MALPFVANASCGHLSTCQRKACESDYFGHRTARMLSRLGTTGAAVRRCQVFDEERSEICNAEVKKPKALEPSSVQRILNSREKARRNREEHEAASERLAEDLKMFALEYGGISLWSD